MKKRNLSGAYFRTKTEDGRDNICFEDLTEEQQDEILNTKNVAHVKSIAKHMAKTLKKIGDKFDIITDYSSPL